eukprot:7798027-Pyramimonas_sp.AAC.1
MPCVLLLLVPIRARRASCVIVSFASPAGVAVLVARFANAKFDTVRAPCHRNRNAPRYSVTTLRNITSFYGSSCANNGKGHATPQCYNVAYLTMLLICGTLQHVSTFVVYISRIVEENYPAITVGWSGLPDGQLGFLGNPVTIQS